MKNCNKCIVFLLIGIISFYSVMMSYEKAYTVEAASIGLGVGIGVLTLAGVLAGAYLVSGEETQEEVKQAFVDYKNATVEGAKKTYEINKQLFNDFVAYAEANGASSACLYSAAGSSYSVAELSQAGFPEFDEWNDYFKKASSSGSGGGWKNVLDKFMLAADLIGLMKSFCNDEFYPDGINGQLFYSGDDGYINRETGEVDIYFETRSYYYDENTYNTTIAKFECSDNLSDYNSYYTADKFRVCARYYKSICTQWWHNISNWRGLNEVGGIKFYVGYDYGGEKRIDEFPLNVTYVDEGSSCSTSYIYTSFGLYFFDYNAGKYVGDLETYKLAPYYPDYISSNIPYFANYTDMYNYLVGNDKEPVNTLPATPSDAFIDNYSNQYITTVNIINDVTGDDDVEPTVTPAGDSTVTPFPTLMDVDGSNTTNNYIINITNILQPIQQSITNIYNFFVIDTDRILPELAIDFVPAEKFQKITEVASVLQASVPADSHDKSGALVAEYPKITIEVPKILVEYIGDAAVEMDGKLVIVLCDFKDYALLFVRFRGFLAATIWLGMIFYILKQFEVTFSIN